MNKLYTSVLSHLSFIIFMTVSNATDSNLLPYLIHNCVVSSFQFLLLSFSLALVHFLPNEILHEFQHINECGFVL